MALLRQTAGGTFIVCFRYAGRQCQRSLGTRQKTAAFAVKGRVEHTLFQLRNGHAAVPDGVDPLEFIVHGKTETDKPNGEVPAAISHLVAAYLDEHSGRKADSTLATEKSQLSNLIRALGPKAERPITELMAVDVNAALRVRFRAVSGTTVMKERQTLVVDNAPEPRRRVVRVLRRGRASAVFPLQTHLVTGTLALSVRPQRLG